MSTQNRIGIVVIGRNEGGRLIRCLTSLKENKQLVYVDSGSTDSSVIEARSRGAEVVELNMEIPFTAARARNEGFERVRKLYPQAEYVQFVDGDCEVSSGWLIEALTFLDQNVLVAAACGRLRERFPELSVYNMLCDNEWDTPIGEVKSCGGIFMMRVDAFEKVHGFRADLIAGEEPELCVRLRSSGWKIWRLKHEMALHDANMTRFRQWWKRTQRTGYTYAEGMHLHGNPPERHGVNESRRAWIWGVVIPMVAVTMIITFGAKGMIVLALYPIQFIRIVLNGKRTPKDNYWIAFFLVIGKFPEVIGQINYFYNKLAGKKAHLIEYK